MIVKPRTIPLHLQKLRALERRLPTSHPQIDRDIARWSAGYKGEQSIDYPLTFLPTNEFLILHDIRLHNGSHFFQIDTLILCPGFILILEIKNISGTLIFDTEFNQFIRRDGEKEEVFVHPLFQVNRHQSQLITWLHLRGQPKLPIETLVVIGNNHSVLRKTGDRNDIHEKVVHCSLLPDKIIQLKNKYNTESLTVSQLKTTSDRLKRSHIDPTEDILNRYRVKRTEIISGVKCPKCFTRPMERKHGRWKCHTCDYLSKSAHLAALQDYSLLISPYISNREAQQFLHIPSRDVTKRLLKSLKAEHIGENRGRKYLIPVFAD